MLIDVPGGGLPHPLFYEAENLPRMRVPVESLTGDMKSLYDCVQLMERERTKEKKISSQKDKSKKMGKMKDKSGAGAGGGKANSETVERWNLAYLVSATMLMLQRPLKGIPMHDPGIAQQVKYMWDMNAKYHQEVIRFATHAAIQFYLLLRILSLWLCISVSENFRNKQLPRSSQASRALSISSRWGY